MRSFFISVFFVFLSVSLFAQDDINLLDLINETPADTVRIAPSAEASYEYDWHSQRHYVSLTIGSQSVVYGMSVLASMGQLAWNNRIGPFTLDYGFNAKHWLRVGGSFRYTYGEVINNHSDHVFDFLARVDFTYLNRRKIKLYSGLGAGLTVRYVLRKEDHNYLDFDPLFNLCVFGLHAGGDHVFFLAESNFGTSEAMRLGIGFHF